AVVVDDLAVDQHAAPFPGDRAHGQVELAAAVAAQGAEDLPGEALRLDAHQGSARRRIAEDEDERGLDPRPGALDHVALAAVRLELAPAGGQAGGHDPSGPSRLRRS